MSEIDRRIKELDNPHKEAEQWVAAGKPCVYAHGYIWKGAAQRKLQQNEAEKLIGKYAFEKGFYELIWITTPEGKALLFNELSANDLW